MGPVLEELVPDVAALRSSYFTHLAEVIAREPAVHELNRIATAEDTGCRYCRNLAALGVLSTRYSVIGTQYCPIAKVSGSSG